MQFKKTCAVLAAGAAFVLAGNKVSFATITLHDFSENPSTGVYTYAVSLDNPANVQANDGFVIYDFPGLASATLSGGLTTSQFSITQSLTSNSLTRSSAVDQNGAVAAAANGLGFDSTSIENISFAYVGPPLPDLGPALATLTLTTYLLGSEGISVYASVDHSGPTTAVPYSFSANPVIVPAVIPEPATLALLAVVGVPMMLRRGKRQA